MAGTVAPYPLLWLNEVQPNNASGLLDNTGARQPWLELYNSSTNPIALDGFFLSTTYTNLNQWAFPTGTVVPSLVNPNVLQPAQLRQAIEEAMAAIAGRSRDL